MLNKQIPPAFQVYASDILGETDIKLMSAEEIGCYFLLLLNLWVNGGTLDHNIAQLQRIMHLKSQKKTKSVLNRMRNQFRFNRKTISSTYINQQLQKQSEYRLKQEKNAQSGVRKRKQNTNTSLQPNESLPYSYSPSHINTTVKEIVLQWNKVSPKKPDHAQLFALERLFHSPDSPLYSHPPTELIRAIKNFGAARSVKGSRAFNWNIWNFFRRALLKYLPGAFDIDHYNPQNFRKERKHAAAEPSEKTHANHARQTAFVDKQSTVCPVET